MKRILFLTLCFLIISKGFTQDKCIPVGWVVYEGTVTGGGSASPVTVSTFQDFKTQAESTEPKVIYIQGEFGNGTRGKTGDIVFIKSNKTIIGLKGAKFKGSLRVYDQSNVIVRNLIIEGLGSTETQGYDCMTIKNSTRIWIDHCEFKDGEDGNLDIIKGSDLISVTWCKFKYTTSGIHNLSNIIGSSDDEPESWNKLRVTMQYCWFDGCVQRMPRVRYGKVHVANCLYTNSIGEVPQAKGAVAAGFMANVLVENNHFLGIPNPIRIQSETTTAIITSINNLFTSCKGKMNSNAIGNPLPIAFTPPYTLEMIPAEKVQALVSNSDCGAGATMIRPTQCVCDK